MLNKLIPIGKCKKKINYSLGCYLNKCINIKTTIGYNLKKQKRKLKVLKREFEMKNILSISRSEPDCCLYNVRIFSFFF